MYTPIGDGEYRFQDLEKSKKEFLDYLDQHNVMDKISEVLVMLYFETEKPKNPIE